MTYLDKIARVRGALIDMPHLKEISPNYDEDLKV